MRRAASTIRKIGRSARQGRGSQAWRVWAVPAATASAVLLLLLTTMGNVAQKLPPTLNDVATDLDDPPMYRSRDLGPLPEAFKPLIRAHYKDVQPLRVLGLSSGEVFAAALHVALGSTRWYVSLSDHEGGQLEAVAVTRVMRFRDDVAIRVRPSPLAASGDAGSGTVVVDMRSKSRLGRGDMGANAARIAEYMRKLAAKVEAHGGRVG